MKRIKHYLVALICVWITLPAFAQEVIKTIECEAGKLEEKIPEDERRTITNLILTGTINKVDFDFIKTELTFLTKIDLGKVSILAYDTYKADVIPESVFSYKSKLTDIVFPEGTLEFAPNAMKSCSNLVKADLPKKIKVIGNSAFEGCSKLTSFDLPASVDSIGTSAFSGTGITAFTWPGNILKVSDKVFYNCKSLTSVNLPHTITSIGSSAFQGCSLLTSLILPSLLENIGSNAFSGSNLEKLEIPGSVKSIGTALFSGCAKLTSVKWPSNVAIIPSGTFNNCKALVSFEIPTWIKEIHGSAFAGTGLTEMVIPNSVDSIGENLYASCASLEKAVWPDKFTYIPGMFFMGCAKLSHLELSANIDSIGTFAFGMCNSLTEVTIPEKVKSIPMSAFSISSGLTKVILPAGLEKIGKNAFASCSSLKEISIPAKVTTIDGGAFNKTPIMKVICEGETPAVMDTTVFNYISYNGAEITVPEKAMKKYATAPGWRRFVNLVPNSKKMLCTPGRLSKLLSEEEKSSLKRLILTGRINQLDFTVMNDMPSLEILDLQESNIAAYENYDKNVIPEKALYRNNSIDIIYLPNKAIEIGSQALDGDSISMVRLPDSLRVIGKEAFARCKKLHTIELTDSIDSIASRAFASAGLTSFTWPDRIPVIPQGVLEWNSNLTSIIIPDTVTTIESFAFEATAITSIQLPSKLETLEGGVFSRCHNLKFIDISMVKEITGSHLFAGAGLESIKWPESITKIPNSTFSGCPLGGTAGEFQIPDWITEIGNTAFAECKTFLNVTLPASVESIGEGCFQYCTNMKKITLSANLKNIGMQCFRYCQTLKEVVWGDNLEIIGPYAFEKCLLEEVELPNSVKVIDKYAFYNNKLMSKITLSNSLETIGYNAFENCRLSEISFAATLKSIGSKAFIGTNIGKVVCEGSTPAEIEEDTFTDATFRNGTLEIPVGSEDAYLKAKGWNKFKTFGIELMELDSEFCTVRDGELIIHNEEALTEIYASSGKLVSKERGACTIKLDKGIYLVKVSSKGKNTKVAKVSL